MAYGYIQDGEFLSSENHTRATKCDVCGKIEEHGDGIRDTGFSMVNARDLGFEDLSGSAEVCKECLVGGIGEEGVEALKEEVFEETEEDTVEL